MKEIKISSNVVVRKPYRKRCKPAKTSTVVVRFDDDVASRLKALAKSNGVTVSQFIRSISEEVLNSH